MKGKQFERDMARELSLYLSNNKTNDGVWLTEGSGGRATNRLKANRTVRIEQHGDLTYTMPELKYWFDIFSVECKSGYAKKRKSKDKSKLTITHWCLTDLIDSSQQMTQFHEFWNQCLTDSFESNREPFLIYRRNRRTPCVAMHKDIFNAFSGRFGLPDFNYISINGGFVAMTVTTCNLRHFFDWTSDISYKTIDRYIKTAIRRRK